MIIDWKAIAAQHKKYLYPYLVKKIKNIYYPLYGAGWKEEYESGRQIYIKRYKKYEQSNGNPYNNKLPGKHGKSNKT